MESRAAAAAAKSLQSCPTLCDPIDGSPPGSPVPGILQARALKWVAVSFSMESHNMAQFFVCIGHTDTFPQFLFIFCLLIGKAFRWKCHTRKLAFIYSNSSLYLRDSDWKLYKFCEEELSFQLLKCLSNVKGGRDLVFLFFFLVNSVMLTYIFLFHVASYSWGRMYNEAFYCN